MDLNKHFWFALLIGFALGSSSFFLAQLLDGLAAGSGLPNIFTFLPEYLFAGVAFTLFALPSFRTALALQSDRAVILKRSLFSVTFAFALFLVLTLLFAPPVSVRCLIFFYAIANLLDWLCWRFFVADSGSRTCRLATYLDSSPHAPFIITGLFLLILMGLSLLVGLSAADQFANWAFRFLVLGAIIALLDFVSIPGRLRNWRHFPEFVAGLFIVALFFVGYILPQLGITKAESIFITDLNQTFLAGRVKPGDIVISASPELSRDVISKLYSSLDVRPDQRGLALWDDLNRVLQNNHRVFWVNVPQNSTDTQGILSTYLKANGCLDTLSDAGLPVRVYEMRAPFALPRVFPPTLVNRVADPFDSVWIDLGAIQINGMRFESRACSHDAIAVAFRWRLAQPFPEPLKISLDLVDQRGRKIQTQDFFIDDEFLRHTDQWQAKTDVPSYHLLVVPFGTPPGKYTLAANVYSSTSGQRLPVQNTQGVSISTAGNVVLGQVQIERPNDLDADPYNTRREAAFAPAKVELHQGLWLDAYVANATGIIPGESLKVTARWRASTRLTESYSARVLLRRGEQVIAERRGIPVDGTYPTTQWADGESVVDRWELPIPPTTPGGAVQLELGVVGGQMLYIADVQIVPITRTFQIPSLAYRAQVTWPGIGDLLGYDLERLQISSNDPLALDLYWRAGAELPTTKDYVAFAQLLAADGHLVAQSDSQPASGQRPTRSWLPGEIITDHHTLEFSDKDYRGAATLILGFYDSETGARVAPTGASGDSYTLPGKLQIAASP